MATPSSQLRTGAVLAYASLILGNVVGVFITPLMLRTLGKSEFGLYTLVGTFVGYLTVLDFGLNNSVVRYVARYRANSDRGGEQHFLAMAMLAYCAIALVAAAVGTAFWWRLDIVFGTALTPEELARARLMFAILVFNVVVALPAGGLTAVVSGYERFAFAKATALGRLIVRSGLVVALLFVGYKAVAIVVLDTALNVVLAIANAAYVFGRLRIRLVLGHLDRKLIREVFSYSAWMVLCMVFGQLFTRIGQLLLGITDGTEDVALYAVAALLVSYYGSVAYVFSNMLLPQATRLVIQQASRRELTKFMIRVGRLQFLVLSYLLTGFVLIGRQFVTLWAGPGYAGAWLIALLVMVPQTTSVTRDVGVAIQQAQNRNMFRSFYLAALVAMAVGFGLLARRWMNGPLAMGVALAATTVVGNGIMNVYYSRVIGIDMLRFYREVFGKRLVALLIVLGVGAAQVLLVPVSGWRVLVAQAGVYTVVFAAVTWRLGMSDYEKGLCRDVLVAVARRVRPRTTPRLE